MNPERPPPHRLRHHLIWCTVGWLMVATVVYLSLAPLPGPDGPPQADKVGHMLAYFSLTIWFAQLFDSRVMTIYGAGFLIMGVGLEYSQIYTGYRSFEYADMGANALGVCAGWLSGRTRLGGVLASLESRWAPGQGQG
jgi:VanZ family protein